MAAEVEGGGRPDIRLDDLAPPLFMDKMNPAVQERPCIIG